MVADFTAWWNSIPPRQISLPKPLPKALPWLSAPRAALARLLAAWSGHGDLAAYHQRFKHHSAQLRCRYEQRTNPLHFLSCRSARQTPLLANTPSQTNSPPSHCISSEAGATAFLSWLKQTNYYSCATRPPLVTS